MYADIVQIFKNNSKPLLPIPADIRADLTVLDNIRAIVFDLYGTLFISESGDRSEPDSGDSPLFYQVLLLAGADPLSAAAADRTGELFHQEIDISHAGDRAAGIPYPEVDIRVIWDRVLDELYAEKHIGAPANRGLSEQCAAYFECLSNPVYPMPGLSSVLRAMVHRGFSLGIVSNAQFYTPFLFPAFLGRTLEECGFDPQLCIWSYSSGRAKPDRLLYREMADRLMDRSITAGQTLYIGNDMLKDIYPATLEGFRTGLFAGDRRSLRLREKELCSKDVKSDIILTELEQVLDVV